MRTNIVIDDKLMDDALKATGLNTKKENKRKSESLGENYLGRVTFPR
jgi:hypothetical protein